MIYADYARRKMHNAVKLGNAEGYPLIVGNAKALPIRDYTIYGNTENVGDMTDNLFNYTEPLTTSAKADENGWFDVSIDNTAESVVNDIYCSTKVNTKLKPNTEYTILCEVSERSGNGKLFAVSSYTTATTGGQFTASWDVTQNNGVALVSRKTRESFENCNSMLRTLCRAEAGQLFHIKFRIAVYECLPAEYQEVEYIESTGKEYIETGCSLNETSVVEIEASLKKSVPKAAGALFGSRINVPYSTGQQNALWWHNEEDENTAKLVGLVGESVYRTTDDTVQFGMFRKIRFGCDSLSIDGIKKFTFSKALYSNGINAVLFGLKTNNYCDTKRFNGKIKYCRITTDDVLVRNFIPCYRKSDNVAGMYDTVNGVFYTNASTTSSFLKGADKTYSFEPYNKYKIPIIVNDETAATAYLDAPLAGGESANYKSDNLPDIMLADGTNTITVGTDVKPKKISAKYYKK